MNGSPKAAVLAVIDETPAAPPFSVYSPACSPLLSYPDVLCTCLQDENPDWTDRQSHC